MLKKSFNVKEFLKDDVRRKTEKVNGNTTCSLRGGSPRVRAKTSEEPHNRFSRPGFSTGINEYFS